MVGWLRYFLIVYLLRVPLLGYVKCAWCRRYAPQARALFGADLIHSDERIDEWFCSQPCRDIYTEAQGWD